ncbi:MAG: DUF934 domain-containing protein [Pseudomonadota bacterium]
MPKLLDLNSGQLMDLVPEADLVIAHDRDLVAEPPELEGVRIIELKLPQFKDGRAFSQARLLRSRFGFTGELRAAGHPIPDQAFALRRVGFDSVELVDAARAEAFRMGLKAYRFAYQRSVNGEAIPFQRQTVA